MNASDLIDHMIPVAGGLFATWVASRLSDGKTKTVLRFGGPLMIALAMLRIGLDIMAEQNRREKADKAMTAGPMQSAAGRETAAVANDFKNTLKLPPNLESVTKSTNVAAGPDQIRLTCYVTLDGPKTKELAIELRNSPPTVFLQNPAIVQWLRNYKYRTIALVLCGEDGKPCEVAMGHETQWADRASFLRNPFPKPASNSTPSAK